ncbi:hypothetical protein GWO43_23230, partial [candidate division KSB1 bacterium]|nr:hypothetical protein [candidate division KSB1 bacterium]NIV70822.1 hypothetical protein [Phycisphaerae bacterium]NIS26897.1 hypothetical protein [candidate division KSB1 bacterium]NIT73733.1 hypothetical protein [candidate division KSB1 bacterium]NIU27628.1 hypothetical protein [candidate division KSB1 bacterium]
TDIPPYLDPNNNQAWGAEYPDSFKDKMPSLAGYKFYDGSDEHARGYWTHAGTKFDFQETTNPHEKGMPLTQQDALGREAQSGDDRLQQAAITWPKEIGLMASIDTRAYKGRIFFPFRFITTNPPMRQIIPSQNSIYGQFFAKNKTNFIELHDVVALVN